MRLDHLLSRVNNLKREEAEGLDCGRNLKHYMVLRVQRKHFQRGACKGRRELRGGVAQLGERLPCKQEAIGSNPFISTIRGLIAQMGRARA